VAEEFTLPNVRAVAQGVAEYLAAHPDRTRRRTVLVGYDTRPLGDRFAQAVAEVLAGNGFTVLLTPGPMPTPAISFAIRNLRTQGGIVITASHNPFSYNGLKFKPSYAGPAEPEMTRWVESRLFRVAPRRVPLQEGLERGKIRWVDLAPRYLGFLRGYVEWPRVRSARFRVAYDAMYGAGQELFQRVTAGSQLEILPVRAACWPVPSSHRPEPIGEHLKELSAVVRRRRCHVGLATDGDADRLGLVGPDGKFVSSQETMALLLWHLLEDRRWRGMVVSTVSSTNLMDRMTDHYRVPFRRTPVGFKHIARFMRSEKVLFGGEESGGFGFLGCVPERDGLLAGLLILEMLAMRRKGLTQILREMRARFGHWRFRRADLTLQRPIRVERLQVWAKSHSVRALQAGAGNRVAEVATVDGAKLLFKDGSWLLLRPSGTEPLLRIYAEARTEGQLSLLVRTGRRIGAQVVGPARGMRRPATCSGPGHRYRALCTR